MKLVRDTRTLDFTIVLGVLVVLNHHSARTIAGNCMKASFASGLDSSNEVLVLLLVHGETDNISAG